ARWEQLLQPVTARPELPALPPQARLIPLVQRQIRAELKLPLPPRLRLPPAQQPLPQQIQLRLARELLQQQLLRARLLQRARFQRPAQPLAPRLAARRRVPPPERPLVEALLQLFLRQLAPALARRQPDAPRQDSRPSPTHGPGFREHPN